MGVGIVEAVRPILEFSRLIYRDILNRPYLIQGDLTSEERKIKINKHNYGHILINQPRGKHSTSTDSSDQNE